MKDARTSDTLIRFGAFELDPESRELRKQGLKLRLQEQPFQILLMLVEHPGKVVTREELQQHIWPSDTFVDFDHGLYNAVKKLREALSDSADSPRYIETLSRRGYRFVAPVSGHASGPPTALGASQDSIAVLPFVNIGGNSENESFADGVTEEIINALTQIKNLHVAARTSAFSFKGKHVDTRIIGEQLNVRTVLEGSVRRAGSRLRITAQLVNVADGYHLWSERYDRELKDIFEIQEEIARAIADRLKVTLEGERQEPLVKARTKNLEAYELYLKGRAFLYKRGSAIPRSLECFQRAVTLDPEYALAWAGLADSYTTLGYYGLAHPEKCLPQGMEASRRAVALDPFLAEAHNALAMACLMSWNKVEAEREFLHALELNPMYIQSRDWYALFYLQMAAGRLEEGVAQAKLAVESDPLSSYTNAIFGLTYVYVREYAEATRVLQHAVELDSESYLARFCLFVALHLAGQFEEAVAIGEVVLATSGRHPWAMASLATALADWGRPADAEALYAELVARARRSYVQSCQLAIAAAAAGMEDEAIRHVREAFNIRDPMAPAFFSRRWPQSARLRACPYVEQIFAGKIWD